MFEAAYPSIGDATGAGSNLCLADGVRRPCDEVQAMRGNGQAEQCEGDYCGPRVIRDTRNGEEYLAPLGTDPQTGKLGYWFRFTTQTSATVDDETEFYPGRPQVLWMNAAASQNSRIEFLRDHTSNSSYGSGKEELIRSIVDGMLSDPCTKAFKDSGLTPPSKLLEKGVVIGPASLLNNSNAGNLKYMGITESARKRDVGAFGSNSIKAIIVRDRSGIAFTDDGRPRIFLNASAFGASLGDYIRHEFIHAGGAPAKPNFFGSDLYWLGWKERILSSDPRIGNSTLMEKVGPTESEILAACR